MAYIYNVPACDVKIISILEFAESERTYTGAGEFVNGIT